MSSRLIESYRSSNDRAFYSFFFLAAALLLLGGYLRWQAAAGDLWLDELVTLELLQRLNSPFAIVWGGYFDNNHQLNSLFLYFLPEVEAPRLLRGLSLFCGVVSLLVVNALEVIDIEIDQRKPALGAAQLPYAIFSQLIKVAPVKAAC